MVVSLDRVYGSPGGWHKGKSSIEKIVNESRSQLRLLGLVLVGLALIVFGVVAWFYLPRLSQASFDQGARVEPIVVSYTAPALRLNRLDGGDESLADYRGEVLLVNLWATWCPPCRAEMPVLEGYYQDHQTAGFSIIAINEGEPPAKVQAFVEEMELSFMVWMDPRLNALAAFQYAGLPSSYVIDRQGFVRLAWTGEIDRAALEKYVNPLIKE